MAEVDAADKLGGARATEAMVSSGDILYIPGFWFHYIVSQDTSLQCNARSGNSEKGQDIIEKCMDGHDHESSRKRKKKSKKHKHFDILTESQI
jgi:ribosomal protein L16 Arg81 hydroxylase